MPRAVAPTAVDTPPPAAPVDEPTVSADEASEDEQDSEPAEPVEAVAEAAVAESAVLPVTKTVSTAELPPAQPAPVAAVPEPVVFVVALDGSGDFRTITKAIQAASYLDEIRIQPGTYTEAVLIDRRITMTRGPGQGPVIIDGGELPALTLDRVTIVEVSDLVLKGGSGSLAAAVVTKGQLRLQSCRLDASPGSAAVGTSASSAQLILVDCIVRAGDGRALAMASGSKGALESCHFSWGSDNTTPFIDPEQTAVVTVKNCQFGQKPINGPFLVSKNLLTMLPEDGMPTLFVEPNRELWPHWASAHGTHFQSLALAADRAPEGSHIQVAPGTYSERVGIVRSLTVSATGDSGAVKIDGGEQSALWINAESEVVLRGLSLAASVGGGTPTVQINGGSVTLSNCRIDNDMGHGLIVTDHYAPSQVSLTGCRVFSKKKAVYGTGDQATLLLKDCLLAGESIALFLMNGATSSVTNSTFDTERYAVELWGPGSSARLEGCTILRASQVLAFKEGAVRSQVQTAGLIVK
ncbi:MAG: pectin methylesterase-like acyl-CoA thioesterase [Pseudohongiellaceae bacterium]|jgi:pectin methylesterase-like acyl-CoA thioesterase